MEDKKRKLGQGNEAKIPAKVVRTVPEDGSDSVPTSLKEIVNVFDQPMSGAWNLNCSQAFYPDAPRGRTCTEGGIYWRDDRNVTLKGLRSFRIAATYSLLRGLIQHVLSPWRDFGTIAAA